jgi:hypothetical protein
MKTTAIMLALLVSIASNQAVAQIRVLTPVKDSCLAYTTALESDDTIMIAVLSGWATGFFSGVAQGSGIDYLRHSDLNSMIKRCLIIAAPKPEKLLRLAAEEIARSMIQEQMRFGPSGAPNPH